MPTVGEIIERSNQERPFGGGMDEKLQSIIDKITGSSGSINEKRNLIGAAGILGGIQQEQMKEAAGTERTKLGIAGQENVAKIGIQPAMAENERKKQMFDFPGIGSPSTIKTPPSAGSLWADDPMYKVLKFQSML